MSATVLAVLQAIGPLAGLAAGVLLELLGRLTLGGAALLLGALACLQIGLALGAQWLAKRMLRRRAGRGDRGPLPLIDVLGVELTFSLLGPLVAPLFWPVRWLLARRADAAKPARARSNDGAETPSKEATPKDEARVASEPAEKKPAPPLLVVTHGPSYVGAALALCGLVAIGLVLEPLLRMQLQLADGQPVFDTLALGRVPGGALALPLSSHPPRAVAVIGIAFFGVLSAIARGYRVIARSDVYDNLFARRDALPFWRGRAGCEQLFEPAPSFRGWARPLAAAMAGLLLFGFAAAVEPPYKVAPYVLSLGCVVVTAWVLHLLLRGVLEGEEAEHAAASVAPEPSSAGWPEVLEALVARLGPIRSVPHALPPRTLEERRLVEGLPRLVSPGLGELLPSTSSARGVGAQGRLTDAQFVVLERLAEISRVLRSETRSGGALELAATAVLAAEDDRAGVTVVAREGSGRTTLALLAAVDHVLSCSRTALVLLPSSAAADRFDARARLALGPSSLRWNVRVRRMGTDVARDLEDGIVPDVIVGAPADLLSPVLERDDVLGALGLLVVDDAEELAGPVEAHVQLALRRLFGRVGARRRAQEPGARSVLRALVIGGPSMHEAHTWQRALVAGVEYADPLRFVSELVRADAPPPAVTVAIGAPPNREQTAGEYPVGPVHVFHDLSRFLLASERASARARLRFGDLVAACEAASVPWCHRDCRDGERGRVRPAHALAEEPRHRVDDPADAVVVFLEGPIACVEREQERLSFAGERVAPALRVPVVAFVRVTDADEALVFAHARASESAAARELFATFPRPMVGHPVGIVRDRHLAAELLERAVEVGEILETFGAAPLAQLRALAREHLAVVESRRALGESGFREEVYLRLQGRAVLDDGASRASEDARLLPAPPTDVQEAWVRASRIVDATNVENEWRVDAGTAHRRYHPNAIFEDARGRFEVVARVAERELEGSAHGVWIKVEPRLDDLVSTPLRRCRVFRRGAAAGSLGGLEALARKRVQLGARGLDLEASTVDVHTEHVATLHLSPDGRSVKNRLIYSQESPDRVRGVFSTAGLFLYPEPDGAERSGPRLDREGARLLAAVLRVLLRSSHRRGERAVEVLLHLDPAGELAAPTEPSAVRLLREDAPFDRAARALGVEDAIVLIDAQEGGNGATRAIARDGLAPLLLAAWAYLRPFEAGAGEDARWRWVLLHDEEAPEEDELDAVEELGESSARERWERVAPQVVAWLAERVDLAQDAPTPARSPRLPGRRVAEEDAAVRAEKARYGVFDPSSAALDAPWAQLCAARPGLGEGPWQVADLDAIFEWMHAHVAYASDTALYGEAEHVATVEEVLAHGAGDCEDTALLFASFAARLGATCRAVLIPGHALCEVALDHRDPEEVVEEIVSRDAERARGRGLRPFRHPNHCKRVGAGWRLIEPFTFVREEGVAAEFFGGRPVTVSITRDPDGSRWLTVDHAQARVLGAVDTYQRPADFQLRDQHGSLRGDGTWAPGTYFVRYGRTPDAALVEKIVAIEGAPDVASAPRIRARRTEDLGQVHPPEIPPSLLIWRRLRWSFAARPGGAERPYVLDLGTDRRALDLPTPRVSVPSPDLVPASAPTGGAAPSAPPRVRARAVEALEAIALARPTLDELAASLRRLLDALREDRDDERRERERAERLIASLVDEKHLAPYRGDPRPRAGALAMALASGTADPWARTLLHAHLRAELCRDARLEFDARGWPTLAAPDLAAHSVAREPWILNLRGRETP